MLAYRYERRKSHSDVQQSVLTRYFTYQVWRYCCTGMGYCEQRCTVQHAIVAHVKIESGRALCALSKYSCWQCSALLGLTVFFCRKATC